MSEIALLDLVDLAGDLARLDEVDLATDLARLDRIADRIRVDPVTGCWLWIGYCDRDGYATATIDGKSWRVHRYVYTALVGPIPRNHVLDHGQRNGCRVRNCVNPAHLTPTTVTVNAKNIVPWNSRKESCPAGHPYDEANTRHYRGSRYCRTCNREISKQWKRKKMAERRSTSATSTRSFANGSSDSEMIPF